MPRGNGNVKKNNIKRRLDIRLPIPALSVNKLYSGRKHRSNYYKVFRKNCFDLLNADDTYRRNNVRLVGNLKFKMEVGFSSPLSDLSNSLKGIEDILKDFYEFDDRQIVSIQLEKFLVPKGEEYMKITITQTKKNIDRRKNGKAV